MNKKIVILCLLILPLLGIGSLLLMVRIEPIQLCSPMGDVHPLCGWQNPEDLAAMPDDLHVIVSEYGGQNGEKSGTLALLNLDDETRTVLYRGGTSSKAGNWGSDDCQAPLLNEFSPHGIHLGKRADGTMQLLVVQHYERESIEMFEVIQSSDAWRLDWSGCIEAPAESMLNDIVATPEDGFLVTHMMNKGDNTAAMYWEYMKSSILGTSSGHVLAWQPNEGFSHLKSSEGSVPNGLEISPDGETIFVNYSGNGEIRRINRRLDEIEARNDSLPPLDNVTWTPDGQLLVAGALESPVKMMGCTNLESGTCPGAFAIFRVSPETLAAEIIYEGGPGTPGGAGTVGLRLHDGSLLIGTFAGDRIVKQAP